MSKEKSNSNYFVSINEIKVLESIVRNYVDSSYQLIKPEQHKFTISGELQIIEKESETIAITLAVTPQLLCEQDKLYEMARLTVRITFGISPDLHQLFIEQMSKSKPNQDAINNLKRLNSISIATIRGILHEKLQQGILKTTPLPLIDIDVLTESIFKKSS